MLITNGNFEDFLNKLCVGLNRANSYNNDCFSSSEIARARAVDYAMNEFIDRVEQAGYSASVIMNPIKKTHNRWVIGDSPTHLKQNLDEELQVDMSDFEQVNNYCENVYEQYLLEKRIKN